MPRQMHSAEYNKYTPTAHTIHSSIVGLETAKTYSNTKDL